MNMSPKYESKCSKRKVLTVTIDVLLVGSVALCAGLVHLLMTPYRRGFYCDDESISYPYHSSTIPSTVLYLVGFGLNFLLIFIVEALWIPKGVAGLILPTSSKTSDNENHDGPGSSPSRMTLYLCAVYNVILPFMFGGALEFLARGIAKYSLGRLRPHFLAVCQPDQSSFNCSTGYIENYKCTGDVDVINQARLSFPSGHASFSVYSMLFLILYIQSRMQWRQAVILRPWIQLILFLMAFYTCISRVFDNKHHWSDILAGAIWGILVSMFVVFKVSSLFPRSRLLCPTSSYHHPTTTKL
ncbi:phospholipid phosphatase 3-like [Mizuhopecten yessoensis]|uniref:Lipid phosphate phosphohydrolase 3 n=1 Tax=Mizuhopecten yessoensis TaxID=6573 RepID=A0A210QPL0_MIZYE|nr:phospholipid phosphatase 3-like [Mizuhopecten yessoensis]XP_021353092.1 phospholipid phosphatase 3-like [Mizuhopecten yessoensis]OWF50673.1 Lipid phosphate phosphohydrolase 3 [Mizuhopecten yessoensis]